MSLILDALKRAERERNAEAVPAPGDVAVPAVGRAPPRGRRWRLVGGVALILIVATIGWKALRGRKPATPVTVAQPQPQATSPTIKARPAPGPSPYVPPVIPGTESVTSLADLTDEPLVDEAPAGTIAPPEPTPAPAPAPAQAQPQPVTPPPQAVEPAAPPSVQTTEQQAPPPEIPPALTQPAPLRKFREMPPDYRADFPALKVEIHVYEKAVQQRFVMVNGRKYRQGERLNEGPQLVEIVPEGMVLEYRGEKILFPLSR